MSRSLPLVLVLFGTVVAFAVPPEEQKKKAPPATDADQAAARVQVEKGLKVEVWASEPLLANPVSFSFDEKGRCFIAETYRHTDGVIDIRGYMHQLDDDIGSRSVEDRLKKYQTHKLKDYSQNSEQLKIVWDSTGSGRADKSDVFAAGFNRPQDGIAAGVLARKGKVYLACIPDLYLFGADPEKSQPTSKASLATGFGIRDQFIGHDLHGLVMGPDGKLYFSIGDRALNVVNKEGKRLFNPDSGAVLRCDPDGSNMELVHTGLRNPQELAFDNFGNLFTFDNNCDSGDMARWVQIVEGGDSGWRCGYQYGTLMHHPGVPQGNRGPWNAEKIWAVPTKDSEPPAYVVPALANFGNGPSGLAHYPGVGLNDRYQDHFFACDFTANPGGSVIHSLAVKPKGASFEVVDLHPFVRNMVPTDCDFGPDGAFYWSDWTGGWDKPKKGRIFKLIDPEAMQNPAVGEAKELLAAGFDKLPVETLTKLLAHPHQKVRLEAQYELVSRAKLSNGASNSDLISAVIRVASESKVKVARLHALWAVAAIGRTFPIFAELVFGMLMDADPDVRIAAADCVATPRTQRKLIAGQFSRETDPRVKARLLLALSRYKVTDPATDYAPMFATLKANDNADPYLRHAAVQALATMTEQPCDLVTAFDAAKDYDTPAVRLGVVLALRKLQCHRIGRFLTDADPKVATEAARAIYDTELMAAMEDLAKLADKPGLPDAIAYRAIAANFKLGGSEQAVRVANFAARTSEVGYLRETALKLLAEWAKPSRRDPITGLTQSLKERPAAEAVEAARPVLANLFAGSDSVRKEAVQTVAKLGIKDVGPLMAGIVRDDKQPTAVRVEAIFALEAVKANELGEVAKFALTSPEAKVRAAARVVTAKANPTAAFTELPALLKDEKAALVEKQMVLGVMGTLKESADIDASLAEWLDVLAAGKLPGELHLDLLEAAQARAEAKNLNLHAPLREKLKALDAAARAAVVKDPLARSRETLTGGDSEKGKAIFLNNAAVYCQRCHKLDGQGGEVGPPLNGIAAKQTREYLLESILMPNAKIAEGYQSVILNTIDGKTITGVLRSKDAKGYTVVTADNKVLTIPKDDVESEKPDKSAMPDDLAKKLSKRELRDVVEFLASLKEPLKK